ncbi:hypothetical protein HYPSUDRAFT_208260 [Hypholoma sublateritium FD-334 SS-4]|uniref:Uncharacterized protein n=1 Tax=Hypholoma sublateritium (strain FD-334 SS-4) TaxID=945553 RepID=A0A0D2N780_HYPSF|nr:hypothetical protein HYPSUDRAFT_208260 [Hypholoma sublateritium FD-334 SS-4]
MFTFWDASRTARCAERCGVDITLSIINIQHVDAIIDEGTSKSAQMWVPGPKTRPARTVSKDTLASSSPDNVARAMRNPRKYGKREQGRGDENPPAVPKGQGLIPDIFASQETRELQAVKRDRDKLKQEVVQLKREKNQLFPSHSSAGVETPSSSDGLSEAASQKLENTARIRTSKRARAVLRVATLTGLVNFQRRMKATKYMVAQREGNSAEEIAEIVGEYGQRPLDRMLGFFGICWSPAGACSPRRFHARPESNGEFELNQKYSGDSVGFCYTMHRPYRHHPQLYHAQAPVPAADRMYAFFAMCHALSPSRWDENIANIAKA